MRVDNLYWVLIWSFNVVAFMAGILRHLIQIMLFRSSPVVLPRSPATLVIVAVLSFLLALISNEAAAEEDVQRVSLAVLVLINLGVYGVYIGLLSFYDRRDRVVQTLIAIIGTETLISLLMTLWALLAAGLGIPDGVAANIFVALFVWSIVVASRIIADALDWPLFGGAILVVTLHLLVLSVIFDSPDPESAGIAWLMVPAFTGLA